VSLISASAALMALTSVFIAATYAREIESRHPKLRGIGGKRPRSGRLVQWQNFAEKPAY
jgi:hypothetical protein